MKWKKVKLHEICEVVGGTTPSTINKDYWGGDIVWLSPVDLPAVGVISNVSSSERKITAKALEECGLRLLPEGSLVYSTRASIGKIGIVKTPLVTNQGFTNLIPSKAVCIRYLAYSLKYYTPTIESLGNSTTFKEVSRTSLKNFEIPLPPLSVQREIAEVLDRADTLRKKDQLLIQKYDELAQSIFYDMFGDPVKNEKGWEMRELGSFTDVGSGSTPSRDKGEYYNGNIPWVKTNEVKGSIIVDTEEKITDLGLSKSSCKLFESDSVIVAMYGQGKTRGNVGLLGIQAATNQACAVIKPSPLMNSLFLFNQLKFCYYDLRALGRGGNQANLNVGMIKNYPVILPPLYLQEHFSNRIQMIDILKEKTVISNSSSKSLFESLIKYHFK